MDHGLRRVAQIYKIPYLHVHFAFYQFHKTIGNCLKHNYPNEGPFRITRQEVVFVAYTYGALPASIRSKGNLMYILYAILTFYMCFWAVDFTYLQLHDVANMLKVDDVGFFERLVVYLSSHHYRALYALDSREYAAWEACLFKPRC